MISGFAKLISDSGIAQPIKQATPVGITSLSNTRPQMLSQNPQMKQVVMANKFAALKQNNPSKYNELVKTIRERQGKAKGGRVGYADGSQPQITQQQVAMIVTMLKKGADMSTISSMVGIPEQQVQMIVSKIQQGIQQKAPGGITGFQKGGMSSPRSDPNPDAERNDLALKLFGRPLHQLTPEELDQLHEYIMNKQAKGGIMEIDYRDEGGFVPPIGKKEREDDIPAMLSNNEFVFTADAVRNAGGGSVKEGAKKMYALMKKLEGK